MKRTPYRHTFRNYIPNADMQTANSAIRQANKSKDPTLLERAIEFRDSVMRKVSSRWKAIRDLKTGRLEKMRAACAAGDRSAAWAILKELVNLDGASSDTKRKAARHFARVFPTTV